MYKHITTEQYKKLFQAEMKKFALLSGVPEEVLNLDTITLFADLQTQENIFLKIAEQELFPKILIEILEALESPKYTALLEELGNDDLPNEVVFTIFYNLLVKVFNEEEISF